MKTTWIPGIVSVTFRHRTADEVIALAAGNGLRAVEWSENAHVLPDDPQGAAELRRRTEAAGLMVAAYGSYFRLCANQSTETAFRQSLRSAAALGAPLIRVWAGAKPSKEADEDFRRAAAREASMIAAMAQSEGIKVAFEWHKDTLTDTNESAMRLLTDADHPNLYCLWQPTAALAPVQRAEGLRLLGNRLLNVHVYSWPDGERGPLNSAEWAYYLDAVSDLGGEHMALLEFVRDDAPAQLVRDAATLRELLGTGS